MDEMELYRSRIEQRQAGRRKKNGRRGSDRLPEPKEFKRGPLDLEFWLNFGAIVILGGWLAYMAYAPIN